MKKCHLALIFLTGLVCSSAKADILTITFDSPVQTGSPGETLQFFGTITNPSGPSANLDSDNFSLTGFDLSDITDDFLNTPLSLDSGGTSGDIELFDVTIPNPFTDPCVAASECGGTYTISDDSLGVVGTAFFTVDVQQPTSTPEPLTIMLMSGALLILLFARKRIA